MVEKTCKKCGFTGDRSLFVIDENTCKVCRKKERAIYYKKNKEKLNADSKLYREMHKEELKDYHKRYRSTHKETIKEYMHNYQADYYIKNKEKIDIKNNNYAKKHRNTMRENSKKWYNTPVGKERTLIKVHKRRRELGHDPINKWIKNSHFHHTYFNGDKSIGIYIPEKLHKSIKHNRKTGAGMKQINKAALEWLCMQSVI